MRLVNKTKVKITVEVGTDMARSAAKISHRDVQTGSTFVARWKIVVKNPGGSLRFSFRVEKELTDHSVDQR